MDLAASAFVTVVVHVGRFRNLINVEPTLSQTALEIAMNVSLSAVSHHVVDPEADSGSWRQMSNGRVRPEEIVMSQPVEGSSSFLCSELG